MKSSVQRGILVSVIFLLFLLLIVTFVPISSICSGNSPMRIDYTASGFPGGPPYTVQIIVNGVSFESASDNQGSGYYSDVRGTTGDHVTFKVNGIDALANGNSYIIFSEYAPAQVELTSSSPQPTTTPVPSADPCATPTATTSPQPTTRAPSDVDDWVLGPGLWSTPAPTPVPTATPTSIITATPTVLPTPTPTPEPAAAQTSDWTSWWWLILLLIIVALVAGYWYFTKQK